MPQILNLKSRISSFKIQDKRGQVMVLTALVLGGTLLSVALIAGLLMLYQIKQAGDFTNSAKAVFAAETGLEWWLHCNKTGPPCVNTSSITLDNGAIFEVIDLGGGRARIIGTAGNSRRALQVDPQGAALCAPAPDVMLIVDRSGSIAGFQGVYESGLRYLVNETASSSNASAYFGLVNASTTATFALHLTSDTSTINAATDAVNSYSGVFDLVDAINLAHNELIDPGYDRDDSTNVDYIIVITDTPIPAAQQAVTTNAAVSAKSDGISIVVFGIDDPEDLAMTNFYTNNIVSLSASTSQPLYYRALDYGNAGGSFRSRFFTFMTEELLFCF